MLSEQQKYEAVWQHEEYRGVAPGEILADKFLELAKPRRGEVVYDLGCGTGRGAVKIVAQTPAKVVAMDFAENCLDESARALAKVSPHLLEFKQHDLTKPVPGGIADYAYCTDVMEHIPPEQVDLVIGNVLRSARKVFLGISTVPDHLGALIGETLHLSVHPTKWWREKLEATGATVLWEGSSDEYCAFYVSGYATGKDVKIELNISEEVLKQHVAINVRKGLQEIAPHERQFGKEVMLLGGGPSLNEFEDEIIQKRKDGMILITTNGAYNWALERGLQPSAQIVVDGREFNKRFVQPIVEGCRYLIASQVHPNLVELLPAEQTWLWHCGSSTPVTEAIKEHAAEVGVDRDWFPVHGGPTVMLRAFPLMIMLGFTRFHVYGFDSSLAEGKHHAFPQPENDAERIHTVTVGGRKFQCHGWMLAQAQQFIDMQKMIGGFCEMIVYGDGLISHILKTGAELSQNKE